MSGKMSRARLFKRAAGIALGASLLGKLPAPVAAAPIVDAPLMTGFATTLPAGYLPCDGRVVHAGQFPHLVNALRRENIDMFGDAGYADAATLPWMPGAAIKAHDTVSPIPIGSITPHFDPLMPGALSQFSA